MNEKELKEFVLTVMPDWFTFHIQLIRPRVYYVVIQDTITEIKFRVEIDLNQVSNDKEKAFVKNKIVHALVFYKKHQSQLEKELNPFDEFIFDGVNIHHTQSTDERNIWFIAKRTGDEGYTTVRIHDDATYIEHGNSEHIKHHKQDKFQLFDVVSIDGETGRIMSKKSRIRHQGKIQHHTSIDGFVPEDEMTLIKHTSLPTLNIGDEVIIHDIPDHEQNTYPLGWTMPDTFIHQYDKPRHVTDIMFNPKLNIPSYQIDNEYWFTPYHLEKLTVKD